MPGFITHLSFGEQSLSFIESSTKDLLQKHITSYGLGLQGPDIFFYHIPAYLFYRQNIGNVMHRHNVMLFFESLINARNAFEDTHSRRICDAYILGFIGHYSLDIVCHPYIYFKSDHFNNLKKGGAYDFGRHVSLETDIDHEVLMHYKNLLPTQFDYAAAITPSENEKHVIASLLYNAIGQTFPEYHVRFGTIRHAIDSIITLNRAMKDPKGKKKKHIRRIEQVFFKCAVISSMIPSDIIIKYQDPCNNSHNKWHNPWDPDTIHDESIFDLINATMPKFIERINLYMNCVNESTEDTHQILHFRNKLLADLSDLSYLSGLPLN